MNKKVAVIGLGNIGSAIADNLAKSSRSFIVAGRDVNKTTRLAARWGLAAEVAESIPAALEQADIIILAIPYGEIIPFVEAHARLLSGKTIIDPSNPIAPDGQGGFAKIIPADRSAGETIAAALPEGARLVKAFGTLGAATLSGAAFATPLNTLFYAAGCPSVQAEVEPLIADAGFAPLYVGGLENSLKLEVFGSLHEFGALGKAVGLEEAKAAL